MRWGLSGKPPGMNRGEQGVEQSSAVVRLVPSIQNMEFHRTGQNLLPPGATMGILAPDP